MVLIVKHHRNVFLQRIKVTRKDIMGLKTRACFILSFFIKSLRMVKDQRRIESILTYPLII